MQQRKEEIPHFLREEYEQSPVPEVARRSTFSVTMVWLGFPMVITGSITGSILVSELGFTRAVTVMVLANLIMFLYVGALGVLGTRGGLNFALLASIVFGRKGYVLASGLLSTTVLGWFAVQTGITAKLVSHVYELNYILLAILAGILYTGITFVGVRGLHWIGMVSVPLFVVLGVWVAADAASTTTWKAILAYPGKHPASSISIGAGLTAAVALFIDAGTMTTDFNRWAKDTKSSLVATFSAFPCANLLAMLLGGTMTAALAVPNANPFESGNMFGYMMNKHLAWVSIVACIFLLCNLGSVCAHCLYNSATGWAHISGRRMRPLTLILGALGIAIAAANVWAFFIEWLSLLGVLVPPIGAIILVDQYMLRPHSKADTDWRGLAFVAWGIGSVTAFLVEDLAPQWSTAISAAIVAAVSYWLMMALSRGGKV